MAALTSGHAVVLFNRNKPKGTQVHSRPLCPLQRYKEFFTQPNILNKMLKIICVDGISMAGIRVRCFFGGIPKRRASLQRIDESVGYKNGMVALASDHAVYKFIFMKTSNLKKVARSIVIIIKIITTFSPRPLIGRGKGVSHEWPCLKFVQIF